MSDGRLSCLQTEGDTEKCRPDQRHSTPIWVVWSNLGLLGLLMRVVDLDAQLADSTLELGLTRRELVRTETPFVRR